jgi:hypothetical protein
MSSLEPEGLKKGIKIFNPNMSPEKIWKGDVPSCAYEKPGPLKEGGKLPVIGAGPRPGESHCTPGCCYDLVAFQMNLALLSRRPTG